MRLTGASDKLRQHYCYRNSVKRRASGEKKMREGMGNRIGAEHDPCNLRLTLHAGNLAPGPGRSARPDAQSRISRLNRIDDPGETEKACLFIVCNHVLAMWPGLLPGVCCQPAQSGV